MPDNPEWTTSWHGNELDFRLNHFCVRANLCSLLPRSFKNKQSHKERWSLQRTKVEWSGWKKHRVESAGSGMCQLAAGVHCVSEYLSPSSALVTATLDPSGYMTSLTRPTWCLPELLLPSALSWPIFYYHKSSHFTILNYPKSRYF